MPALNAAVQAVWRQVVIGLLLGSAGLSRAVAQSEQPQAEAPPSSAPATTRGPAPQAGDEVGWGEATSTQTPSDAVGWGEAPNTQADAVGWGEGSERSSTPSAAAAESQSPPPEPPTKLRIQGRARLRTGLWTERLDVQPLAQARGSLDLGARFASEGKLGELRASFRCLAGVHTDYDAAYLVDRDLYDRPTIEAYRSRTYLRETLVGGSLAALSLSVGWQINTLGQGEVLGVLDVLTPRDLREPGLTDVEDLRLPILTSRLGLTLSKLSLDGFVIHESNFGFFPPALGTFSPFRKLILDNPFTGPALSDKQVYLRHARHGFAPAEWQYLGRASYSSSSFDMEWYGGSVLDRLGVPTLPSASDFGEESLTFRLYHPRYTLLATSGAWALGSVLLRYEIAGELDRPLATRLRTSTELLQFDYVRRSLLGTMLGATYFGARGTNLGVELQRETLLSRGPPQRSATLLWPVERLIGGLRLTQDFPNEVFQLRVLSAIFGLERFNGAFARADLSVTVRDGIKLELGYLMYFTSQSFGPFYGFSRHDRALLALLWDFNVL